VEEVVSVTESAVESGTELVVSLPLVPPPHDASAAIDTARNMVLIRLSEL